MIDNIKVFLVTPEGEDVHALESLASSFKTFKKGKKASQVVTEHGRQEEVSGGQEEGGGGAGGQEEGDTALLVQILKKKFEMDNN